MAKSAALGFTLAGVGAVAVISGIQGKSIAQVLKGEIGEAPNPAFAGESSKPENTVGGFTEGGALSGLKGGGVAGLTGELISPFPKGTSINWGRSDQGVDGTTPPGTPLRAMGSGTVEIKSNCAGFGCNYVVLHVNNDGTYYYGHAEPTVHAGPVTQGQIIARTHVRPSWGNSTTPGGFEIGKLGPKGEYPTMTQGKDIRTWLQNLPMI